MAHPNFLSNSRTLVIGGSSGIGVAVASAALASGSLKVHLRYGGKALHWQDQGAAVFLPEPADVHISGSAVDLSNAEARKRIFSPRWEKRLIPPPSPSITLSSAATAHRPVSGFSSIIGAAGAIEAMSKALAVDLAPIRVNVIITGAIESEFLHKMLGGNTDVLKNRMLTNELGTFDGAAEAYLFCKVLHRGKAL
ncbi:hypothetical protein C8R47DRAFT_1199341 [Mycena vitilis]|nr:hypothetical protein C8R47DRAFT_1199341 [Mycena vitilis]